MRREFITVLFVSFALLRLEVSGQENFSVFVPSDSLNKSRSRALLIGASVGYTASIYALNELWYADYERGNFRFFDDSREWLQMDKAGHALTSYQLGRYGYNAMRWAGIDRRKSLWLGGSTGLIFLTTIEVLDGFSEAWGFSTADAASNLGGTALFIGQELLWEEQRIMLKFSYSHSPYASQRPKLLGETDMERILKDYNGQTIWLSVRPASFLKEKGFWPEWLCLSLGYSGNAMLGGHENPQFNEAGEPLIAVSPYRQYLLSFDIDLTQIRTRSPFLKTLFSTFGFLKVPAPALELSQKEARFHWIYF